MSKLEINNNNTKTNLLITCDICNSQVSPKNMKRHKKRVHKGKEKYDWIACDICKTLVKPENLNSHKKRAHAGKNDKSLLPNYLGYIPLKKSENNLERINCTCQGENQNCFRCYGVGYYDRPKPAMPISQNITKNIKKIRPYKPANFASDYRGGEYSIRETGRFSSLPIHDSYDENSTP